MTRGKASAARLCFFVDLALSLSIALKVGLAMTSVDAAVLTLLASFIGWFGADFVGAVYHWNKDNYAKGHNGFLAHHRDPNAIGRRSLDENVAGAALPLVPFFAVAAWVTGGPLAAFLLGLLNGILFTEHAHGYSHADGTNTPLRIRVLQGIPVLPILLPPERHRRHHAHPLGKDAFGGLNGWSNAVTEATGFFRMLEAIREGLTGEKPAWRREERRGSTTCSP